jgi:predicted metal-dependent hydrolase
MPAMASVAHPKLSRTLRELAQTSAYRGRCTEPPPALLVKGVQQFNAREFFECHETLEELWRAEEDLVRYLYQGILHVGVGYYHLSRGNHHGAITKLSGGPSSTTR